MRRSSQIATLFLCSSLAVFGQLKGHWAVSSLAGLSGATTPVFPLTNTMDATMRAISGFSPDFLSTNSSVWHIKDLTGLTTDYTNADASTKWPKTGPTVNGHASLWFDKTAPSYMKNAGMTDSVPTYVFFALALTNTGASGTLIQDSMDSAARRFTSYAPNTVVMGQATSLTVQSFFSTNIYVLFEIDFLGSSSSTVYTNNVQGVTPGNAGNQNSNGKVIGQNNAGSLSCTFTYLGHAGYTNRTTAGVSNIWWSCTNGSGASAYWGHAAFGL